MNSIGSIAEINMFDDPHIAKCIKWIHNSHIIIPIKVNNITTPKAQQLKVTWKKNAKADGYRIRYSTSESFKSYKTVTVKSNKTLNTTIKSLKKNTKYYVKVQSYKKNSGKTYYSAWSDVKSKKTKK